MEKRLEAGEAVAEKGELLSYLLCSRNMSREEVYANVTELMLAGVDTVSAVMNMSDDMYVRADELKHD